MASPKIRVAIIDDYQGLGLQKFSFLKSRVDIESFNDHIDPSNSEGKNALIKRLFPFNVIATMRERTAFPADIIESLPNLTLFLTTGIKNTAIDMDACKKRNIIITNSSGYEKRGNAAQLPTSHDSTLEHCWALILGISRNIARDDARVKNGLWETTCATGLRGKTLSLLGLGALGSRVASIGASAFGMRVLAWSRSLTQEAADEKAEAMGLQKGTFQVAKSLEELLKNADVLTIHYVLSEKSKHILAKNELALLKPSAVIVNTSRGPLIEEKALLEALNRGKIRGAALDVHNTEPLPLNSQWRTTAWGQDGRSEVLLSPHMGYVEEGVMNRWYEGSATNLELWLDGKQVPLLLP
ncbi:D-isomer specific 2-hydroxyacid dehydrogenase [Trichoderma velutinum]